MTQRLSSVFPRPSASDADDVVWTLQTAAVQWQRGLRADAIVWVRKAAETATQLGHGMRAEELRNHAARLAEFLWSDPQEETLQDAPVVEAPRRHARRVVVEDADEVIELEELDPEDLEFTENELETPDDAVADLSGQYLSSYGDSGSEPTNALPDDMTLQDELTSEETLAFQEEDTEEATGRESYVSVSPEPDEESDSYISISPEPDAESEPAGSVPRLNGSRAPYAPSVSDGLARPRVDRFAEDFEAGDAADGARSPTLPSNVNQRGPRLSSSVASGVSVRPLLDPSTPPGPTLEELARLLAPHSSMAKGYSSPPVAVAPAAASVASPLPPPPGEEGQPPSVDGLPFESVEALADLPEDAQAELSRTGQLISLTHGQQLVLGEGAALVTRGAAHVTLTHSDVSAARVGAGAVIAARGSVEAGPLRLIADSPQTHIVTWDDDKLAAAMRDCPWVVDDLRLLADRFHAHASAGLGPLGERLDDALRAAVYDRLQVRVLAPGELVAERGKPLKGLFVVAVGELQVPSNRSLPPLRPGEFVFPSCVIGAAPAPHDVQAGPNGGLVLFATRPVAHDLMMSVPPLLEILAS